MKFQFWTYETLVYIVTFINIA